MLYVGLDLSRKRVEFDALHADGERVVRGVAPADADGLDGLERRLGGYGEPIVAAVESMNGARFVHDRLELHGWEVEIADAQRVKGLAPLACKTDKIDAWVLAELCRRELVPAIWLPGPEVRAERESARFRLHLVRRRPARRALGALPRALRAHPNAARKAARTEGRRDRRRTQALRGDLAHAHPQPALRSGRRHVRSGGMTALD